MQAARRILKALCLVLVGAALAVPAVFVNTVIGYAPVLFYVFLLACCYAYCLLSQRAAVFDLMASAASCERGQAVRFKLRAGNKSVLFLYGMKARFAVYDLFGNVVMEQEVSLSLAPRASHDFMFDLGLPHLGEFEAGVESIAVRDPLGLFCRSIRVGARHSVLVTPRMHDVAPMAFSTTSTADTSDSLRSANAEGADYTGVRSYEKGDPLKTIHWKLSAHSDDYLTKLFESHSEPRLDVYINFAAPEGSSAQELMELNDIAVESALSVAAYAHGRGLESSVVYIDDAGDAHRVQLGRSLDMRSLIRQLPLMGSQGAHAFLDTFLTCACSLHSADNVALCSPVFGNEVAQTLLQVKGAQRDALLCALVPNSLDSSVRTKALGQLRSLDGSSVRCLLLDSEMDVLQ